ncbi:hypothetical protein [Arenibacter latericius]|uniref:hypothetical protein n=1 Tax=Arenibacter latericius TaxID=86104 RepID=UPI00047D0D13|nr:hypothetical protein [Arenibacter latericius]MDX1363185.1 hypothetical protein [Arenibacter latericius]
MKKSIKFLSLLFITTVLIASCSKDNDPTDDDLFVGTYKGSVSYNNSDSDKSISSDNGSVTLVKVGDNYNFNFSDGIPSLTGIKMEKNQSVLISLDGTIKIDEGTLIIGYKKDNENWAANCDR